MLIKWMGASMAKNHEPEGAMNTIVGKGTKIEGKMDVTQSIRIDGSFKGALSATDTLIIGATGELLEVDAKVKNAIIGGNIKGNISATNKVTLESTSRLEGDLTAKLLIIEEGALFTGNCSSGEQAAQRKLEEIPKPIYEKK